MMTSTCNNNPEAAKIHPKYLKSNASVHTWVFSAIAELIDNAYDANSKELLIDIVEKHDRKCLCFQDNGAGMDRNDLFKMLSFGFTTEYYSGRHQLGRYGNGFKSGSMRLGDDALVFTRSKSSAYIGFLSWTYLDDIKAESVLVPILEYKLPDLDCVMTDNFDENLRIILEYSPFEDEDELKAELHLETVGTKIIISELRQFQNDDNLELDFSADQRDIQCSHDEHTPKYKYSLREYCSILFLLPRMKIKLRGEKVKTKIISECLTNPRSDFYQPALQGQHKVKVTFGLTNETSEDCGMMLYHRNRLIMAFQRLRCQMQPEPVGIGVIGVTKVNFLTPIHNKQDFTREDKKFESAMKAYNTKLKQYVIELGKETSESHPLSASHVNWVQCDECMKWRRLSDDNDEDSLPREWYCRLNPDKNFNNCDVEQELEADDEDDLPSTNEIPGKKGAKATARRNPTRKRSAAKSLSVNGRAGTSSGSLSKWLRTSSYSQGTSSDKQGTSSYRQGTSSDRQRTVHDSSKTSGHQDDDFGGSDSSDNFLQPSTSTRSVKKPLQHGKGGKRKSSNRQNEDKMPQKTATPSKHPRHSTDIPSTSKQSNIRGSMKKRLDGSSKIDTNGSAQMDAIMGEQSERSSSSNTRQQIPTPPNNADRTAGSRAGAPSNRASGSNADVLSCFNKQQPNHYSEVDSMDSFETPPSSCRKSQRRRHDSDETLPPDSDELTHVNSGSSTEVPPQSMRNLQENDSSHELMQLCEVLDRKDKHIKLLGDKLTERNRDLDERNRELDEKNRILEDMTRKLGEKNRDLDEKNRILEDTRRRFDELCQGIHQLLGLLLPAETPIGNVADIEQLVKELVKEGNGNAEEEEEDGHFQN